MMCIRIGNFVHTNNINISIVCVDKGIVDDILLLMCQHCAKELGLMKSDYTERSMICCNVALF